MLRCCRLTFAIMTQDTGIDKILFINVNRKLVDEIYLYGLVQQESESESWYRFNFSRKKKNV